MLSILPFDRVMPKDSDRPFKAYTSLPAPPPTASYYPTYQQSSAGSAPYFGSYGGSSQRRTASPPDSMELPVRPSPHMYDQGHHPHHPAGGLNGGALKTENGDMQHHPGYNGLMAPPPPHLYGMHDGVPPTAMHSMPPQMPTSTTAAQPHGMSANNNRVSSSMSPTSESDTNTSPPPPPMTSEPLPMISTSRKVPPKKRPLNVPDELKDTTYWEKRKKNNESAKRSREQRRMKEEQIAMRVVYLEQENLQLRTEVSLLKTEIEKLRCMLYNS